MASITASIDKKMDKNMRVLIISGFLGSGKTTLLLSLAKKMLARAYKIAIIENEIGEIGIDGDYISRYGLEVQEIYGGCICCTLNTNLRSTLEKLGESYKPDWVILEPTGAAIPNDIVSTVSLYTNIVESYYVIGLIDPLRYEILVEMMTPLLDAQLESADIIIINKIDEIRKKDLIAVKERIKSRLKSDTPIALISAEKEINIDSLLDKVL